MEEEEDDSFLDDELPAFDTEEMEELYRAFLVDDMPEDDEGDEDFEPPAVEAEEEEDDEEEGVRRRNIRARELNDLLQDAYKQLGPAGVPPGLRERALDQLSMHFQLLVQTGVLSVKAIPRHHTEKMKAIGMLEHLACASGKEEGHGRRTRASGIPLSAWWDADGERIPPVGIPGLLPGRTIRQDLQEAGTVNHPRGNCQQAVERLMTARGGVIWPQLLPSKMQGGVNWHVHQPDRDATEDDTNRSRRSSDGKRAPFSLSAKAKEARGQHGKGVAAGASLSTDVSSSFSLIEDRLLCRGVHKYNVDWDIVKEEMLPHKSTSALMHRYAVLSGWASINGADGKTVGQAPVLPWTPKEDAKLRSAVEKHGKKWANIARDVMPYRGREALRSRWSYLQDTVGLASAIAPVAINSIGGADMASLHARVQLQNLSRSVRPCTTSDDEIVDVEGDGPEPGKGLRQQVQSRSVGGPNRVENDRSLLHGLIQASSVGDSVIVPGADLAKAVNGIAHPNMYGVSPGGSTRNANGTLGAEGRYSVPPSSSMLSGLAQMRGGAVQMPSATPGTTNPVPGMGFPADAVFNPTAAMTAAWCHSMGGTFNAFMPPGFPPFAYPGVPLMSPIPPVPPMPLPPYGGRPHYPAFGTPYPYGAYRHQGLWPQPSRKRMLGVHGSAKRGRGRKSQQDRDKREIDDEPKSMPALDDNHSGICSRIDGECGGENTSMVNEPRDRARESDLDVTKPPDGIVYAEDELSDDSEYGQDTAPAHDANSPTRSGVQETQILADGPPNENYTDGMQAALVYEEDELSDDEETDDAENNDQNDQTRSIDEAQNRSFASPAVCSARDAAHDLVNRRTEDLRQVSTIGTRTSRNPQPRGQELDDGAQETFRDEALPLQQHRLLDVEASPHREEKAGTRDSGDSSSAGKTKLRIFEGIEQLKRSTNR